jgi:hypothetical protein
MRGGAPSFYGPFRMYRHHFESRADVAASPDAVFAYLDDQERLSAHMMSSSAMMAGTTIRFEFDEHRGRALGSTIRLSGRVLGFTLEAAETIIEREPPRRKLWQTVGEPRLLVIGGYRMGFEIRPEGSGSRLLVFIDYDEPSGGWRFARKLLGGRYAQWCTRSIARGTAKHFESRRLRPRPRLDSTLRS